MKRLTGEYKQILQILNWGTGRTIRLDGSSPRIFGADGLPVTQPLPIDSLTVLVAAGFAKNKGGITDAGRRYLYEHAKGTK